MASDSDIPRAERMAQQYPMTGFRYLRDKKNGWYYNFAKSKWVEDKEQATPISPGSQRVIRSGNSSLSGIRTRYELGELEFVT